MVAVLVCRTRMWSYRFICKCNFILTAKMLIALRETCTRAKIIIMNDDGEENKKYEKHCMGWLTNPFWLQTSIHQGAGHGGGDNWNQIHPLIVLFGWNGIFTSTLWTRNAASTHQHGHWSTWSMVNMWPGKGCSIHWISNLVAIFFFPSRSANSSFLLSMKTEQ